MVISSAEYLSCKICHSKVVASEDGVVAECSKCGAVMKVVGCNKTKSARFVVRDASGWEVILSAFEPILSEIVSGVSGHNFSIKLLMTPKKLYRYNDRNVVLSVQGHVQ